MSIRFSDESSIEYEDVCLKELQRGFEGKNWMLLRVPPKYRENIMQNLNSKYPQYHFQKYEISGIWIYGDLNVNIASSIRDYEQYSSGIIRPYSKYISQVCEKFKTLYPEHKFSIVEHDDSTVISVDDHHLKLKQ